MRTTTSTDLARHRLNHLFAVTDQPITDRPAEAKPCLARSAADLSAADLSAADLAATDLSAKDLPVDWPRGYGRRRDHRRADPAAAPPPLPPEADVGSDPSASTTPPRAASRFRFRFRLPSGLHSLLWVDRRAVLGLSVLLLLAVAYAVQHFWFGRPQAVAVPAASTATAGAPRSAVAQAGTLPLAPAAATVPAAAAGAPDASAQQAPAVVVDVAGKVAHPGLRSLPGGSRVADAVQAAGGAQPGVDTDELNLARILVDGEQILVGAPAPPAGHAATPAPQAPVSLNRATWEQLDALPGIGPVLAQHIIDFRGSHAGFRSLDQLRQISGIGARKFAELKPLLTL
ncbi:helix-hairpin-helix domain-containing protein [Kitasatospora sp. MAA4]|uniref:helix-hairpin-helix domain-containing protein n=1 Tax=Kitasatospora sp. MAA4 TaxID=3035093 RepID=UPI002473D7D8|nr:helix-hairpin-helix domain-containing protein [Kitasatospora sp. MAA4]